MCDLRKIIENRWSAIFFVLYTNSDLQGAFQHGSAFLPRLIFYYYSLMWHALPIAHVLKHIIHLNACVLVYTVSFACKIWPYMRSYYILWFKYHLPFEALSKCSENFLHLWIYSSYNPSPFMKICFQSVLVRIWGRGEQRRG